MKNNTIFEPEDFAGGGQLVIRNSYKNDHDFGITVAYKVGWVSERCMKSEKYNTQHRNVYCLIALSDGMIHPVGSLDDLCKHLNEDQCGYRVMTKKDIENLIVKQGHRFRTTTLE